MMLERIRVGVVMERRPARSRWLDHVWRAVALVPGGLPLAAWAPMGEAGEAGEAARFHAGSAEITVHPNDTKVYKDNLEAPQPSVYVVLRRASRAASPSGLSLYRVTVDPSEAHSHVDVGDDLVEALPMPDPLHAWLSAFVARHHVERRTWKRQRDRARPDALARRAPLSGAGGAPAWSDDDDG